VSEAEQVAVRPTIALLVLDRLVREVVGRAIRVPVADGIAQTATPAAHGVGVFGEVEQMRADAADLAHVRERVSLCLSVTVGDGKRQNEDGWIVLGRAASIADLNDAVDGTDSVGLDATENRLVVLLHEIAFRDVKRASFGAEDKDVTRLLAPV
jgi:hypothetical protein